MPHSLAVWVTAVSLTLASGGAGWAASYPERTVTLIAPFAAGGTSDVLARIAAQGLTGQLGNNVVVENKTGAGGIIGLAAVAKAKPDGYTIGLGGVGSLVHSAGVYEGKIQFDVRKDFVPISLLATIPVAIAVSTPLGVSNLRELAQLARKDSGAISYGSAGVGGALHLGAELFQKLAGVKMTHVPFRGVAPAMVDLLGGQIPVVFGDVNAVLPHVGGDKIKVIAVLAEDRVQQLPNVPTAKEQGFPNLIVQVWYGLVAPAGVPDDIVRKIQEASAKVVNSPEFQKVTVQIGFTKFVGDGAVLKRLIDSELALWLPIIKEANITPQ